MARSTSLKEAFLATYDRSWGEDCLRRWARSGVPPAGATWLGTGSHFEAFRVSGPRLPQSSAGQMPDQTLDRLLDSLVVKKAADSFPARDSPTRRHWVDAMRAVARVRDQWPLVPPWDLIELDDGTLGMVMPYGDRAQVPDAGAVQTLQNGLGGLGLELADTLQVKAFRGVPFIVDWSDLRRRT